MTHLFFFNDPATTEIYTLSLHDALPISASALETSRAEASLGQVAAQIPELERAIVARENQINFLLGRSPQPIPRDAPLAPLPPAEGCLDRKSTRLNSSHTVISYAFFCFKKKNTRSALDRFLNRIGDERRLCDILDDRFLFGIPIRYSFVAFVTDPIAAGLLLIFRQSDVI